MPRRNRVTALWLLVSALRLAAAFTVCRVGGPRLSAPLEAHRESILRESSVSLHGHDGIQAAPPTATPELPSGDEDFVRLRNEIRKYSNSDLYRKYSSIIPMTVSILRREYGERANWWGDLTASETRLLYWRLLPSVLLIEEEFNDLPLKDRAYIASMARYAAKLYARERSMVPERAAASLYDGTRSVLKTGRWSWTGLTVDEIWLKYEREVKAELEEESWLRAANAPAGSSPGGAAEGVEWSAADADRELYQRLYQRIIQRSCATNPMVDRLAMLTPQAVLQGLTAAPRAAAAAPAAERRAAALAASQSARLLGQGNRAKDADALRGTGSLASPLRAGEDRGAATAAEKRQRAAQLVRLLQTVRFKEKVLRLMASVNFASLVAHDNQEDARRGSGPAKEDEGPQR